jgi:glycosyltransferase involved in cell wall biosynthesis
VSGPLISVVLPVFNGEATIRRALDSVFAQDAVDLDVVVCNDGSTDATPAILSEYGSRIGIVSQENRGRGAARNASLGRTRADLIALLDADDWWPAGKLAAQLTTAERLPETGVFFGNLNNLAVACARLGDRERACELLPQAIVQPSFYSDAIGNLHALEATADPAALRITSRRVFQ